MDDRKQGGEEMLKSIPPPKGPLAEREEVVLAFWNKHHIFNKSLKKDAPKGEYVFYDGPPFATGLPHYGHLLQSAIKDAIPRYRTMQGYHVDRVWGWDCHGLPLENQIEQELGFKTKRDIEQYGVENFNEAARNAVLRYADDWKKIIPRFGRWVDMDNDYRTMDETYTESVWWAFKNLYDKGLIYDGFKAMQYCPRCGTTLSNNEVGLGYKDIDDIAVTVKLPLVDEPGTSLLIWTTTPWTLPGNTAAAVNEAATYVKVKVRDEYFIFGKDLSQKILSQKSSGSPQTFAQEHSGEVVAEFLGKTLVGKKYEPPFDYFKNELHKHKTHAFKVYAADYVTMDSGTGIVHIAPAFGDEDLKLAQKEKIPLIHHVTDEGKFTATVSEFAGLSVKPKGNPRETDEKVAAWLQSKGLLFAQEKIKHSYPHCWRCDTPLLNWASNSWFVKVASIKSKLIAQNKKVSWVPQHVGSGRFNNLLEGAPDWAISRSRYWGAPIPVWRNTKTKEIKVLGSVDELLGMVRKSGNSYYAIRHGLAEHNIEGLTNSNDKTPSHLTDEGKKAVALSAKEVAGKSIDLIITSPLIRTRETAAILQKELGLPDSAVMVDERLREINFGSYDGKPIQAWREYIGAFTRRFTNAAEGGETYVDIRRRVGEFLFEIESRYSGKHILIVSHIRPLWSLGHIAKRNSIATTMLESGEEPVKNSTISKIEFTPFPHNKNYELDLHRPYIDEIPLGDAVKGNWQRVPDVFDCWFESGSMPYASNGYPKDTSKFNPKRFFGLMPKGYPAHFIAEGIDQTRGWFYSLIVLGVGLFGKTPYLSVITNGQVLAQDGRKMSKKLKNYPDPLEIVERYGADSVRYYLLSSQLIRGEDLRFVERGVDEIAKKLLMRLDNVRSFYDLYRDPAQKMLSSASAQILDRWILSRLNEMAGQITKGYESYELDNATRPLSDFIDDLSTWYVRRSRERFKTDGEDKNNALATLRSVLYTTALVMAPVMPFFAEDLYQKIKTDADPESVHLCSWPTTGVVDEQLNKDMQQTRKLASVGLQMREKAGIKLRQPLALFKAKVLPANTELLEVLKDEINVKEVSADAELAEEAWLDPNLTDALREEGIVRDIVRHIQDWRKSENLQMSDRASYTLVVEADEKKVAEKNKNLITRLTNLGVLTIEQKTDA